MVKAFCLLSLALIVAPARGQEPWVAALARMPIGRTEIGRSNAIEVLLTSVQPNDVFKAVVVLPSVADDFYLIHRGHELNLGARDCGELVTILTNRTNARATFLSPFLVVHVASDRLPLRATIKHPPTSAGLESRYRWPNLLLVDRHWARVQPELGKRLQVHIRPKAEAEEAWHFGRHNTVGWNLNDLEALTVLGWAGGTRVVVSRKRVDFVRRER